MLPIISLFSDNLTRNRQSTFSPLTPFIPLPKYFESEWSYAQYRIPVQSSHISISGTSRSHMAYVPDEERCVVGWVEVPSESGPSPQGPMVWGIIALTYAGGWYRLSLPAHATSSQSSTPAISSPLSSSPPRLGPLSQPRTSSPSSVVGRDKGKEKERDRERKDSRECILREFRRFGRWDGWG